MSHCTRAAVVIVCLLGLTSGTWAIAGQPGSVWAARSHVSDLSGAALQSSDVPSAYRIGGSKVYSAWIKKMVLQGKGSTKTTSTSTNCATSSTLTRSMWKQGLISYKSKDGFDFVQECAYIVGSDTQAKAVYSSMAKNLNTKVKGTKTTFMASSVGDQSKALELKGSGIVADAVLWRHGNAIVGLADFFFGKQAMSRAQILHLASSIDGRL